MASFYYSEGGWIEVTLPPQCVDDCANMGDVSEAVEKWHSKLKDQMNDIPKDQLAKMLKGYGSWDDGELEDHIANQQRLIWMAACQIDENEDDDEIEPESAHIALFDIV